MTPDPMTSSPWQQRANQLAPILAAGTYVAVMYTFYPFRNVFEFDPDEGINLIKAVMVDHGHQLYSEVWNDQPPLFTQLLRWWLDLCGWDVAAARMLVLLFAGVIVFALYDTLRLLHGHRAAAAAVLLLPCTTYFSQLSVSIMLGVPAIALAILSVWALVHWTTTARLRWVLVAGVLMGLSLATKLFTGFLLPLVAAWMVLLAALRRQGTPTWHVLVPAALWTITSVLTAIGVLGASVPLANLDQLYAPHAAARALELAGRATDVAMLLSNVRADWPVMALAAVGTALAIGRRQWTVLIAPAWCVVGFWALWSHSPVWYHHHLLLTVPACLIAGVAVGELFTAGWDPRGDLRSTANAALHMLLLGLLIALAVVRVGAQGPEAAWLAGWSDRDWFTLALIKAYPKRSPMMVTDRPMYAFRSGYDVPPNLSVISRKRLAAKALTPQEMNDTIASSAPEHILFSWKIPPDMARPVTDVLGQRYELAYADAERMMLRLYVRKDVADDALPLLLDAAERMPTVAPAHDWIGLQWARRGRTELALASFQRAHTLDPTASRSCQHLADAYMSARNYGDGFAVLQECLQTSDHRRYLATARLYAWRRATCPDPAYRNSTEAEALAREVLQAPAGPQPVDLETVAAARAARGQFDAAHTAAQQALDLARQLGQDAPIERITRALAAYRNNQIWIETAQFPTS